MWQRVQLEDSDCKYCTWSGKIANPTTPSLYSTMKDWKIALDMAWSLPEVKCPGCGKKLNRKAIWAE